MGPNPEGRRTPHPGSGRPAAPDPDSPGQARPGRSEPGRGPVSGGPRAGVRPAADADAPAAAALHAGQISQGFLSLLGQGFLRRLYRRINRFPGSFLLIAESRGATVGFIAGSTDVAGLYRNFLWHDGIPAAVQAAGPLIGGWRRVLDTLGHARSGGSGVGRGPELLAVAVDPTWQGRGVGRSLVLAFVDEVVARGGNAAHVVVGADNRGAVSLYERAGFVPVERFELHAGTESLLMQWDRPGRPPAGTGPA